MNSASFGSRRNREEDSRFVYGDSVAGITRPVLTAILTYGDSDTRDPNSPFYSRIYSAVGPMALSSYT
jgi:hypothetical protein